MSRRLLAVVALALCTSAGADPVTLYSMNLSGAPTAMPLGRDASVPGGYATVQSTLRFSLSPVHVSSGVPGRVGVSGGFFDVYFDVWIKDADPSADFSNGAPELALASAGAAHFDFNGQDYVSNTRLKYALGYDVNGNGTDDILRIEQMRFSLVPDATDPLGAITSLYASGSVADATSDPPFTFQLSGPTTASSDLFGEPVPMPAPATLALLAGALAAMGLGARRGAR